jgi:cupin 2 domain-containing protein
MQLGRGNIFQAPAGQDSAESAAPVAEQWVSLLDRPQLRLEQIISHGQPTPAGQWYQQADAEWVLLVRGEAQLLFADARGQTLRGGDYLLIPAGLRHRVEHCSADALWLALHFAACGNLAASL